MLQSRISSARAFLRKRDIDFLVVTNLLNVRYLCGFTGSEGALILGYDRLCLVTDFRYTTQAAAEAEGIEIIESRRKFEDIAGIILGSGGGKVGFEAASLPYAAHAALAEALAGVELVAVAEEFDEIRMVKEPEEISLLEKACTRSSSAFLTIIDRIRPGATELELALELEIAMKRGGVEDKAFNFIVASGSRGALPHGRATDKVIQRGELVTFDFGGVFSGYHSDETVTVAVGEADGRLREIYGIVKDAHDLAIEAVRPGISGRDLDSVARSFIEQRGYGSNFGHGLGHGVGLDVHEKPSISARGETVLAEGMVCTIEPGIYIPGWGGVRIEDTVLVTASGCRILTQVPKNLLVV